MWWLGLVLVLVALGYGLHRLALWAEGRGWIHYKTEAKYRGSSLGLIEGIYNPGVEHVMEERAGDRARGSQDESGDKPDEDGVESPDQATSAGS
ncbi:MAG: hypothetical protein GY720_18480 [bacterium]|nr:hypothetical protein [bacterium]